MILLTPGLTPCNTHFANVNGFAAGGRDEPGVSDEEAVLGKRDQGSVAAGIGLDCGGVWEGDELSSWRPGLTVVDAETEIDAGAPFLSWSRRGRTPVSVNDSGLDQVAPLSVERDLYVGSAPLSSVVRRMARSSRAGSPF